MRSKIVLTAIALVSAVSLCPTALAQESSYTRGTVLQVSGIDIKDGQFENYLDYLATTWKKTQELAVKEGLVVSYRVWQVNDPRPGEPDLYLAVELKDYVPTAQQEAFSKKINALLGSSDRKEDQAFGDRGTMRTVTGSMQMQELKLK